MSDIKSQLLIKLGGNNSGNNKTLNTTSKPITSSLLSKSTSSSSRIFTGDKIRSVFEDTKKKLEQQQKAQEKYQKDYAKWEKEVAKFNEQNRSEVDKMRDNFARYKQKASALFNKPYQSNLTTPGKELPKSIEKPINPDAPAINKVASYMSKLGSEHLLLIALARQNTIKLASAIKELEHGKTLKIS